jgi:hypothetical protein
MLRLKFWIGGALVALAATGIAVAATGASTSTASATFSAEAKRVATKTCQGADGTYKITRGLYEGKMTSTDDARLNGPVRIKLESYYNATESAGWMRGELRVRNGDDNGTWAQLSAVNLDGNVEGLLSGGGKAPRARLLANFSAKFDTEKPDSISGELGQGGSANEALFFGKGCQRDEEHPKPNAKPANTQQPPEKPNRPDNQQQPTKDTTPTR